jgi:hypothetical protein
LSHEPKILIQFEGCTISTASRTYNFLVTDAPGQSRSFSVRVPSELFSGALLKFQDGPPISFERLQQEIGGETPELQAKANLNIGETDIQEYLDRHYPRKERKRGPTPRPAARPFF